MKDQLVARRDAVAFYNTLKHRRYQALFQRAWWTFPTHV